MASNVHHSLLYDAMGTTLSTQMHASRDIAQNVHNKNPMGNN